MNELIRIAVQRYSDDEYNYKRIYDCVMWGYNNSGSICQDNSESVISQGRKATYKVFFSEEEDTKNDNRGYDMLER